MKRYVLTGGDNGYCGRCGGVGDRSILEIDDEKRTIKGVETGGICLGRWCWHSLPIGEGWHLKRYDKQSVYGGVATEEVETYGGKKLYLVHMDEQGNETERRKVVVKGSKWGKDGEYKTWRNGKIVWDKIQNYEFIGWGGVEK